jgi:hypothetical protein
VSKAEFVLGLSTAGGDSVTLDIKSNTDIEATSNLWAGSINIAGGYTSPLGQFSYTQGNIHITNVNTAVSIFSLYLDGYTVDTNALASNYPGGSKTAFVTLNSTSISSIGGAGATTNSFTVSLSEGNFTSPTGNGTLTGGLDASSGLAAGVTLSGQSSYNATTATPAPLTGPTNASLSSTAVTSVNVVSGYSLDASLTVAGLTSGNSVTQASEAATILVPGPSGLILAATMVPFVGLLRRRLRLTATPVVA